MGDGIDPSTLITSDPTESTLIILNLNNDCDGDFCIIFIKQADDVVIDGLTIT